MGTCEQRDTGQGHPDKGTGRRMDDYLQIHGHFCWNGRLVISIFYRQQDNSSQGHPSTNMELSEALNKLSETLTNLPSPTPDIMILAGFDIPHVHPDTKQTIFIGQGYESRYFLSFWSRF